MVAPGGLRGGEPERPATGDKAAERDTRRSTAERPPRGSYADALIIAYNHAHLASSMLQLHCCRIAYAVFRNLCVTRARMAARGAHAFVIHATGPQRCGSQRARVAGSGIRPASALPKLKPITTLAARIPRAHVAEIEVAG